MIYHIRLHEWLFVLTLYPGALLLVLRRIPIIRKKSGFFLYLVCLSTVAVGNLLLFERDVIILKSIGFALVIPFILFSFEYLVIEKNYKKLNSTYKKNRVIIQSIVQFPILEELIFRYFIYQYCILFGFNAIQYVILSTGSFVIAHVFYQGYSSIIKTVFSICLNIIFLMTMNVFITISIHIVFNFFVYLMKTTQYDKYKTRW